MSANAPYYQMRPGRFVTTPSRTNATPSHIVSEDDEHDASPTDVASPSEHRTSSYPEHAVRQTSADTPAHTFEENHNLAELLEAATTAAGQAAQAMDAQDVGPSNVAMQGEGRRKRASSSIVDDVAETSRADALVTTKRRRVDVPTDPQLQGIGYVSRGSSKSTSVGPSGESLLDDARAAGVHSAAALFRRTSEKTTTRKYTRPPMSKLFMSLQLSPENFLQLQAQAKTYMLDTTYPERQNCVGNRGKGDTDMVKLRLFNCVRDFLSDGVGERFFGENVEKPGERDAIEAARALGEDTAPDPEKRLTWPRDGNKIISLVTPLMRRMVTNERQRMYAIETRKGGSKKKDKEGSVEAATQQVQHSPSGSNTHSRGIEPAFDPSLSKEYQGSQSALPALHTPNMPGPVPTADMVGLGGKVEHGPTEEFDLPLPTDTTIPHLNNINIFLVIASNHGSRNAVTADIRLDQKRIISDQGDELTEYPWDKLVSEVINLLRRAKARYPEVRQQCVAHRNLINTPEEADDVSDSLRELAAAANAIQGDSVMTGTQAHGKDFSNKPDLDRPDLDLPRYVIKTVGCGGWETIDNAPRWNDLLSRTSREVWADGKLNLVVELVDIRAAEKGEEVIGSEGVPMGV